jgi:hypothetical protein
VLKECAMSLGFFITLSFIFFDGLILAVTGLAI